MSCSLCQASRGDGSLRTCMLCCSVTMSHSTLCDSMAAAHQASLPFTISQSLPKFMSIESVMPSKYPLSQQGEARICIGLFKIGAEAAAPSQSSPGSLSSNSFFQDRDTKCFVLFLLRVAPMYSNAYLSTTAFHSWNRTSNSFTSPSLMSWKALSVSFILMWLITAEKAWDANDCRVKLKSLSC